MASFPSWNAAALRALLALLVIFITRSFLAFISFRSKARQQGCQPPPRYPHTDPVFGLDFFAAQLKERKIGNSLVIQRDRFSRLGKTYEVNSWGTRTVHTLDQENIRDVLATSFDKFGVQSMRLAVGEPFIDPGVFTTDGPYWEHSRQLIKPIFARIQISELSALDVHLDRMFQRLPLDGSTIELQGLLKLMVCSSFSFRGAHIS
jgi:cytochrome P450